MLNPPNGTGTKPPSLQPDTSRRDPFSVKKIRPFTVILTLLLIGTAYVFFATAPHHPKRIIQTGKTATAELPPHYDEVMKILRPLEYSGFYIMENSDIRLSIDFKSGKWTLHNVRKYGADGNLLLEQGRYGLCAELAAYTYRKVLPIFGPDCVIKFVGATEPEFFDTPGSNHVILAVSGKHWRRTYLLDPSYHLYKQARQFNRYVLFEPKNELELIKKKDPDISLTTDGLLPLQIRRDHLIFFSVESLDGKLDPDHFLLAITAKKRGQNSVFYLLALKKNGREIKWLTDDKALKKLLSDKEEKLIRTRLLFWMTNLSH